MSKCICVKINGVELPAGIQLGLFQKQVRYIAGIEYEITGSDLYITYNEDDKNAVETVNNLGRFFLPGFSVRECDVDTFSKSQTEIIHPICEDIESTAFTYISMYMPVVMTNESAKSWYYSNFINLICENQVGFYTYTDDRSCYKRILLENASQFIKAIKVNKEMFVNALFEKYYIYVLFDSYYTGDWDSFGVSHDAHPILIYGVNLNKNIYYCYRFSTHKGVYKCEYDIDLVHSSIESVKCYIGDYVDDMHVSFFKVKEGLKDVLFDKERFLHELENYLFSNGNRVKEYCRTQITLEEDSDIIFGLGVTRNVIRLLSGECKNNNFDYRLIHLITEQKHLLLNRFRYIVKLYKIQNSRFDSYISLFSQLVASYDSIKKYYMKESLKESGGRTFYSPPTKENSVRKIILKYEELMQSEIELLGNIYEMLRKQILVGEFYDVYYDDSLYTKKTNEKTTNGICQYIELEHPVETNQIDLYDIANCHNNKNQGYIEISDGSTIEMYVPATDNGKKKTVLLGEPKKIKWVRFYPQAYHIDEKNELSTVVQLVPNNLLNKASNITASSIIQVEGLNCSPENMLYNDQQFWCPAVNDTERSIVFKFNDKISFNCAVLSEAAATHRITTYKIEYFDGEWKTAVYTEDIADGYSKCMLDGDIITKAIKLTVTNTKRSENGFDVPNIKYFAVYSL